MRWTARRVAALLLAGLAAGAAGWALHGELSQPAIQIANAVRQAGDGGEALDLPAVDRYEPQPLSRYEAVLRAPLFSPDRRPWEEEAPPADGPGGEAADTAGKSRSALQVRLLGILVTPSKRLVVMSLPGETRPVYVARGEEIQGWRLAELGPDSAVFTRGEERMEVDLGYLPGSEGNARAGTGQ